MPTILSRKSGGSGGGGAPSGPAGGDLGGTYPNPTVESLQANAVDTNALQNNAVTAAKVAADVATQAELEAYGTWTSYVPALTASVVNPTLGSGAVQLGRYIIQNDLMKVIVELRFGSSGTAAGTGEYRVSLPFDTAASQPIFTGSGVLFDASASDSFAIVCEPDFGNTRTKLWVAQTVTAGVVGAAVPFAWAASDGIFFSADFILA